MITLRQEQGFIQLLFPFSGLEGFLVMQKCIEMWVAYEPTSATGISGQLAENGCMKPMPAQFLYVVVGCRQGGMRYGAATGVKEPAE